VLDLIYQRVGIYGDRDAVSTFRDGAWQAMSFEDVRKGAHRLSNYLISKGIERGDRIAIICESSAEFGVVFFSCARAGGTLVPLDPKLSTPELLLLVLDSRPRVLFCSRQFADAAKEIRAACDFIERLILTDAQTGDDELEALPEVSTHILQQGREREADETALIVYTSGSTGAPKGAMITFHNLIFQAQQFKKWFEPTTNDVFLSTLPMNHLLEFTAGYLAALYAGAQICYISSPLPGDILRAIKEKRVTFMIVVPTFLQLIANHIDRIMLRKTSTQMRSFQFKVGLAKLLPARLRKKFFPEIAHLFGKQFKGFVSSGAPLASTLARGLDSLGINVYQGYGLTETSSLISTNSEENFRLSSAGKPLPEIDVRISNSLGAEADGEGDGEGDGQGGGDGDGGCEGEILTRGAHVMKGYFQNDVLTSQCIDSDGWLHTGDLGRFDDDGFLHITGRLVDLIVLADGKKVHPREIESFLVSSSFVKDICVLSAKNPVTQADEMVAVVVPYKLDDHYIAAARKDIDQICRTLDSFKKPKRIAFSTRDLPHTQSGNVKRQEVARLLECEGAVIK